MNAVFAYRTDTASISDILVHLSEVSSAFVPPLDSRVDLADYAAKLKCNALLCEAWSGETLVGLVAGYCNDQSSKIGFITSVSVLERCLRLGIGKRLVHQFLESARQAGMIRVCLEVSNGQPAALRLYAKLGFRQLGVKENSKLLGIDLSEKLMTSARDYNLELNDTEEHKYAYDFDLDVMHPFMLRSFLPLFRPGSALELGSFRGDFTRRLQNHFTDITCVEASDQAIAVAHAALGDAIHYVHALFETVNLPKQYDNVVLTHVLEHLDDPIGVLRRVNDEWLSDKGRLFLVCPNANAPSRQIAVKMGLISHNTAITPAEAAHGHRNTYTLDTLEREVVAAGLNVVHRSGIFFKALANFQWDRLLRTDIISPEYLEGCFKLGQVYPDLCSSIFLVCERGNSR